MHILQRGGVFCARMYGKEGSGRASADRSGTFAAGVFAAGEILDGGSRLRADRCGDRAAETGLMRANTGPVKRKHMFAPDCSLQNIKKPAERILPVLLFGFEFSLQRAATWGKGPKRRLDRALDFAAPQATGANGHALGRAVDDNANVLDIGSPNTPGLVVSMADVVAGHDALIAHLTELAHTLHLLRSKLISQQKIL